MTALIDRVTIAHGPQNDPWRVSATQSVRKHTELQEGEGAWLLKTFFSYRVSKESVAFELGFRVELVEC